MYVGVTKAFVSVTDTKGILVPQVDVVTPNAGAVGSGTTLTVTELVVIGHPEDVMTAE